MRVLLIIFLSLFVNDAYALGGKVYSLTLNNKWIKQMPHVHTKADRNGQEWYCGANSNISTMWGDDSRKNKKLLMGVKLSKENKQKHLNTFNKFLSKYQFSNKRSDCYAGRSSDLETWIDYKNNILGAFKVIRYDTWGCMIFQTLIQKKQNIKTNVAIVCQKSHGTFYDFITIPKYFKVDLDLFERLNQ